MNAGDYIVVFQRLEYVPPTIYRVLDAPSARDARKAALWAWGYHPGCPITVREYRRGDTADYVIEYKPLTQEQEDSVRYND